MKQLKWAPVLVVAFLSSLVILWVISSNNDELPISPTEESQVTDTTAVDGIAEANAEAPAKNSIDQAALLDQQDPQADRTASDADSKQAAENGVVLIQVVDSAGNPVEGVEVAVGMRVPMENRAVRLGKKMSAGVDGIARVKLDKYTLDKSAGLLLNPELLASAKFPSRSSTQIKFMLQEGQEAVQQIVMPEFQWLQARVQLPDGSAPDFQGQLHIMWSKGEGEHGGQTWSNKRGIWVDFQNGLIRFPCEPDMQLSFRATANDAHRRAGYLKTPGPELGASAPPPYEITMGGVFPRLQTMVLLPNGEPAREVRLVHYVLQTPIPTADDIANNRIPAPKRPSWRAIAETDAEGRIDLPIDFEPAVLKFQTAWAFVLQSEDRGIATPRLDEEGATQVRVDLPSPTIADTIFKPGPLQLQTVELPLLAAGRATDGLNHGIGVSIRVYSIDENSNSQLLASVRSKSDGSFELLGKAPGNGQVRVTAGGYGWMSITQVVASGTNNLLFELTKGINIKGIFLMDDGIPWQDLEVKIPKHRRRKEVFGGGFTFDYMEPGEYSIALEHNDIELYSSPNFTVTGSGDVAPPILNPIDLRGKFHTWNVIPLDSNGKPFAKGTRFLLRYADEGIAMVEANKAGRFYHTTLKDVAEISIHTGEGYEPLQLSWPLKEESVQLRVDQR